jgi:hypothetical protein
MPIALEAKCFGLHRDRVLSDAPRKVQFNQFKSEQVKSSDCESNQDQVTAPTAYSCRRRLDRLLGPHQPVPVGHLC